jgi:hypothetical protein
MWRRACEHPNTIPTLLLGEASFHQFHGGVATNGEFATIDEFFAEYRQIRGREFESPTLPLKLVGTFVHLPPNKEMAQPEFASNRRTRSSGLRAASKFARLMSLSNKRRVVRALRWTKYVLRFDFAGIRRDRAAIENIRDSEFFDRSWYLTTYPEVALAGWDPAEHYFLYGATERRNPSPDFNSPWYTDRYVDVKAAGVNPLLHYLHHGKGEGRRIRKVELDASS